MFRKKMYFANISNETNFQCRDILIFYFAYLLKLNKDKKKTVNLLNL